MTEKEKGAPDRPIGYCRGKVTGSWVMDENPRFVRFEDMGKRKDRAPQSPLPSGAREKETQ